MHRDLKSKITMAEKNFYDIFGLTEDEKKLSGDAFDKALKNKYKKLARQWHPDKFSTKSEEERKNAEEKFKEISEAYNTLSDPQKRQQYDFSQNGGFDPFGGGFDPFDIFGRRSQQPRMYKGKDIQVEIVISLEDAYYGNKKEFTYETMSSCGHCNGTGSADGKSATCPHCNGSGMVTEVKRQGNMQMMSSHLCPHCKGTGKKITKPCPHCHGKGMKVEKMRETIEVPKGSINGSYIILNGKGYSLPKGIEGVNGDLHVVFTIKDHNDFDVDGSKLYATCNVDVFDALLGCETSIKCIDGSIVKLNIPELTKSGHRFIIKGKGMPLFRNPSQYDDLVVEMEHILPKKLSDKQREMLKQIKEN